MKKLLFLLLCACHPSPSKPHGPAIAATLRAAANDAPIVLVAGDDGLVARDPDSEWSKVLVPGAIAAALYQPEARLLWYAQQGTLAVIDLDGDGAPITIATSVGTPAFAIKGADGALAQARTRADTMVEVVVDPRAVTVANADVPIIGEPPMDEDTAPPSDPVMVGADWLRGLASRMPSEVEHATWEDVEDESCDACKSTDFGKPALHRQLIFQLVTCDDGWCTGGCTLSDDDNAEIGCDVAFDASDTRWITGDSLCDGSGCHDAGGLVLGWLDPGRVIDDPSYPAGDGDGGGED